MAAIGEATPGQAALIMVQEEGTALTRAVLPDRSELIMAPETLIRQPARRRKAAGVATMAGEVVTTADIRPQKATATTAITTTARLISG